MAGSIIIQLGVCHTKMGFWQRIRAVDEFAPQLERANIRRVLKAQPVLAESFIGNRHCKFPGRNRNFAHHECVFARQGARSEANELHEDFFFAHFAPALLTIAPKSLRASRLPKGWPCQDEKASPPEGRLASMLEGSDVRGLQALGTLGHVEFNRLAFVQRLVSLRLNRGEMDENVLAGLPLDESKSLAGVKPLYCSLFFQLCFSLLCELFGASFPLPLAKKKPHVWARGAFSQSKGFHRATNAKPLLHTFPFLSMCSISLL